VGEHDSQSPGSKTVQNEQDCYGQGGEEAMQIKGDVCGGGRGGVAMLLRGHLCFVVAIRVHKAAYRGHSQQTCHQDGKELPGLGSRHSQHGRLFPHAAPFSAMMDASQGS
jgi:hypothetical protein